MDRDKEMHIAAINTAYDTTDHLDGLSLANFAAKSNEQLIRDLVTQARDEGASWADIGAALGGISRQAAQQRFS